METTWFGSSPILNSIEGKPAIHITADGVVTVTRRWQATVTTLKLRQTAIRGDMPAMPYGFSTFSAFHCKCIESDIDPVEGKAELYQLTETYQGYNALPFTIYTWTTSRLDRPIQLHPKFDTSGVMEKGLHWYPDPVTGLFQGFPAYTIQTPYFKTSTDGSQTQALNLTSTPNPYRGIDSYAVPTGTWKKTSFAANADALIDTTSLWKVAAPDVGSPPAITGIPNVANAAFTANGLSYQNWLKTQDDQSNLYRGASELWQREESWWWNSLGWLVVLYS